jgi:hypothetical protein
MLTSLKIDSRSQYQTSEASKYNQIFAELTNTLISPFQMASAMFGNSKPLLSLEANTKHFLLVYLLIALTLKAAFIILQSLLRRPWWKRGITAVISTVPLLTAWRYDKYPEFSDLGFSRGRGIRVADASREVERAEV